MKENTTDDSKNVKYLFKYIHYVITVIFFIIILLDTISLTTGTIKMTVSDGDTNAETAKNLMISAISISYVADLLLLIFLGICYSYKSNDTEDTRSYYDKLMKTTGGENLYAAMRVIVFSTLMFVSLVVASLCYEAANYINKSDDPSQYQEQYNLCKAVSRLFMEHFTLFSLLQGGSYIYEILYNDGTVKKQPGGLMMG